jgi:hypothetical protein
MIGDEEPKPGRVEDLAGPGSDDAEIRSDGDDVVDRGVDFGVGEEGNGVLEVEHLAAKLIGLGVDEDELIGEVLGENDDVVGDGGKKGIRTRRDEEGDWESEKILIKNVCSVEQ